MIRGRYFGQRLKVLCGQRTKDLRMDMNILPFSVPVSHAESQKQMSIKHKAVVVGVCLCRCECAYVVCVFVC